MDWHILGLGVSAVSWFGRYRLPSLPSPLASAGMAVGLGLAGLGAFMHMQLGPSLLGLAGLAALAGAADWQLTAKPPVTPKHAVKQQGAPKQMGSGNTIYGNAHVPDHMGDNNTIVGATDSNGNTIINKPTSVGANAGYAPDSVIIGAGAGANLGKKPTPPKHP